MTALIGILNLTPDSFSDGGIYHTRTRALAHCVHLIADGADIIDVGAESTRPGAAPLSSAQEWERLEPLLAEIIDMAHTAKRRVSLDTYHPQNAKRAIDLNIDWINDVSGLTHPDMIALARSTTVPFVVMHHLGIPASKQTTLSEDQNPVTVVKDWITHTIARLKHAGINPDRLVFDPGIGFGKTATQSIKLIQQIEDLMACSVPLLVGHSRKSFLPVLYPDMTSPDEATLAVSRQLVQKGVAFLRVHDIAMHRAILPIN